MSPPLLWTILVDDLLNIFSKQGVEIQCYADDLATLVSRKHKEVISNILQQALNTISRWCDREQMSLNPNKNVSVPFTLRRKLNKLLIPSVSGVPIQFEEEVKYLGNILDKNGLYLPEK